jgi:hypothetical protein
MDQGGYASLKHNSAGPTGPALELLFLFSQTKATDHLLVAGSILARQVLQ